MQDNGNNGESTPKCNQRRDLRETKNDNFIPPAQLREMVIGHRMQHNETTGQHVE